MNKVILIGRLASDPVAKVTLSNNQQSSIIVACDSGFRNVNGQNSTVFIPCIAWGNNANFINKYLKKGNLVSIEGKINRRSYISKTTNQQVTSFDVIVDNVTSLTTKTEQTSINNSNQNTTISTDEALSKAFPETAVTNLEQSEQKVEKPNFDQDEEINWFEENENNDINK